MLLLLQSCQCHKIFTIHWKLLSLTATQDPHFHSGEREDIRAISKIKILFCVMEMREWWCIQEVIQSGGQGLNSECATNLCESHTLLIVLIHSFRVERLKHLNSGIPDWKWSAFQRPWWSSSANIQGDILLSSCLCPVCSICVVFTWLGVASASALSSAYPQLVF